MQKSKNRSLYYLGLEIKNKEDLKVIKESERAINVTLEGLGFTARVCGVDILENYFEYFIEVAIGTDLQKLEKHDRALALALASPTGKAYWQIPAPGKSYIGLKVPRIASKSPKMKPIVDETDPLKRDLRMKAASIFYGIGKLNFNIAQRIIGVK